MASVKKRKWTYKGVEKEAWVVRYKEGGKHRSKQFERKKEADGFRVKVEGIEASGAGLVDSTISVAKVCDFYMNLQQQRLDDGRIGRAAFSYSSTGVRVSVIPLLGHLTMNDLSTVQVEGAYSEMVKNGGLLPRTALRRVKQISEICEFAVKHHYASGNVSKAAIASLRGIAPPKVDTFNQVEMQLLLGQVKLRRFKGHKRPARLMECAVNLAAFCGLRFGEIMGLTLDCIDVEKRQIRVRHSLTRWDEHKVPKTNAGNRDIPVPQHIIDLLSDWVSLHYVPNPRRLIFRYGNGGILHHSSFSKQWVELLGRAGLKASDGSYHFHALRHFCASWMITNGLPITDVAALLGHSKFDMTLQVYAHPITPAEVRRDAIDAMSAVLITAV